MGKHRNNLDSVYVLSQNIIKLSEEKVPSIRIFTQDTTIINDIISQHPEWLKYIHFFTPENKSIEKNKVVSYISIVNDYNFEFLHVFDKCWEGNSHDTSPIFIISDEKEEIYNKINEALKKSNEEVKKINIYYGDNSKSAFRNFVLNEFDYQRETPFGYANSVYQKEFEEIKSFIIHPLCEAKKNNRKVVYPINNYENKDETLYELEKNNIDSLKDSFNFFSDHDEIYKTAYENLNNTGILFLGGFGSGVDYMAEKLMEKLAKEKKRILKIKKYTARNALKSIYDKEYKVSYQGLIYRNLFDPRIFIRNLNENFFYDINIDKAEENSIYSTDIGSNSNIFDEFKTFLSKRVTKSTKPNRGNFIIITTQYDEDKNLIESLNSYSKNINFETISNTIVPIIRNLSNTFFCTRGLTDENSRNLFISKMEGLFDFSQYEDLPRITKRDKIEGIIKFYGIFKQGSDEWAEFRTSLFYYFISKLIKEKNRGLTSKIINNYGTGLRDNMNTVYQILTRNNNNI